MSYRDIITNPRDLSLVEAEKGAWRNFSNDYIEASSTAAQWGAIGLFTLGVFFFPPVTSLAGLLYTISSIAKGGDRMVAVSRANTDAQMKASTGQMTLIDAHKNRNLNREIKALCRGLLPF